MKPAWESLGAEYAGSNSVMIGDADCTASGKELCTEKGVSGYPTIKYYLNGEEHAFSGGRDLDSLKKFVEDTLEVKCSQVEQDNCTPKQLKYMDKVGSWETEKTAAQIARLDKMKGKTMSPVNKQYLFWRLSHLSSL